MLKLHIYIKINFLYISYNNISSHIMIPKEYSLILDKKYSSIHIIYKNNIIVLTVVLNILIKRSVCNNYSILPFRNKLDQKRIKINVGRQRLISNLWCSSVTSLNRPISFEIPLRTITHVGKQLSINNKNIEKKLFKPTNLSLQILNIITKADKQQHIKEKILTMDQPKLFTIYHAKKDIKKLINASKQFLNDFFSQIDVLINKDIDFYMKTNKEKQGISVSYKKIKDLLKAIKKKQQQYNYEWFDSIINTLNDFLTSFEDNEQFFINKKLLLKTNDKKIFYKIFLEEFKNKLINWKKEIFYKIKSPEIVFLTKQQLNKIDDKAFVNHFNNLINNQEINLNLISIMFDDMQKKDFTNLTKEQHTDYIKFMDSILLSYGSKNNLLKIMVDPSKGLIALCFYSYSKKKTQIANFNTLVNILMKFNNYLKSSSNNKYFVNSMTLNDFEKYKTEIFNLMSNTVKKPESDTLEKFLDNKGMKLSYEIYCILKTQNIKRKIIDDKENDLLFKMIDKLNIIKQKTKWVRELEENRYTNSIYLKNNIKDEIFLDCLLDNNIDKKHDSAGNLLSFLFADRNIIFISDLSCIYLELLVEYFIQMFDLQAMFEDFSFKILSDFYAGMGLIRYYVFHKKNNEKLTKNEIIQIRQSFIDFQYKHDIEIINDFSAK